MSKPISTRALAAALALGLAAAPSAQDLAPADADAPGTAVVRPASTPWSLAVDDADPGPRRAPAPPRAGFTLSDRDPESLVASFAASPPRPADATMAGWLEDGRSADSGPAGHAVDVQGTRASEAVLATGRERPRGAAPERRVHVLYTGPLADGRSEGARPAVEAGDPAQVAPAPHADAREVPAEALALQVAGPNPAVDHVWIALTPAAAGPATVALIDVRGREVLTAFDGPVGAGETRRVRLDVRPLAVGPYVVVATLGETRSTATIQVVR